jgi:hypothetical protein
MISISFCTFSSVTFTISPLTLPNTSVLISIFFCTFVQKEIDINTEVLGIVNSEIVKVTDENVQKEIDINVTFTISPLTIPNTSVLISIYFCTFSSVKSEIVKVTDESVQKEIDINTEVLGIVNGEMAKETYEYTLICYFYYFIINYS